MKKAELRARQTAGRERIARRREQRLREVPARSCAVGTLVTRVIPSRSRVPLVVGEEERAVPARSARRSSRRTGCGCSRGPARPPARSGCARPARRCGRTRRPVPRSMFVPERVSDVDLARRVAAERRIVGGGHHLELPDGVDRRPHRRRVQLRVDVVDAVEQEVVEVLAPAVAAEREIAAHRAGRSLRRRRGARGQQRQLEEVAAVERQVAPPDRYRSACPSPASCVRAAARAIRTRRSSPSRSSSRPARVPARAPDRPAARRDSEKS